MCIELNVSNFKDFIYKDELVLVDFWATWCGPCRMIAPVLERLNNETGLPIGKVNVDLEEELLKAFQIHSIPALLAFKSGKLVGRGEGFMPYEELEAWINSLK